MYIVNEIISAAVQLALLTLIPFVFYAVRRRRIKGFFEWIGLSKTGKAPWGSAAAILVLSFAVSFAPLAYMRRSGELSLSGLAFESFSANGWSVGTIAVLLIWAVIQTALSEEIFFRGFIGKHAANKLGWAAGTGVQAAVFGAMHLFAVTGAGVLPMVGVFLLTGGIGFALGWLSLKKADGSILYGWAVHAAANAVSYALAFCLMTDYQ